MTLFVSDWQNHARAKFVRLLSELHLTLFPHGKSRAKGSFAQPKEQTKQQLMKKILVLAAILIGGVSAAWAADHPVTVSDFAFTPRTVTAVVGDTISWTWVSGMHTTSTNSAHVPAGAVPWNKPIDASHTQFVMTVTVAGTYKYRCNFHFRQGMTGQILVSATGPRQVPATH